MTREEALDILHHNWTRIDNPNYSESELDEAFFMAIEALSAEAVQGEWIETAQDYYETVNKKGGGVNENTEYFTDDIACSECLTKFSNIDNETERFNYCPNCGAKMDGERSEE